MCVWNFYRVYQVTTTHVNFFVALYHENWNFYRMTSISIQTKLIHQFGRRHGVREILLVCHNQQNRIPQFVCFHLKIWKRWNYNYFNFWHIFNRNFHHFMQLFPRIRDPFSVRRIHDENNPLRILVVETPQISDSSLTTYVPNGEGNISILHRFYVKP